MNLINFFSKSGGTFDLANENIKGQAHVLA